MCAAKRENTPPGPEALAYGLALRAIFSRQHESQARVARALRIDPAQLSRFFSAKENTVAAKEHADALVDLVRRTGAEVPALELAELHELRRKAQEASPRQIDRVSLLQEQMADLKAVVGTFRRRLHAAETTNTQLTSKIEHLLKRVKEEEKRADRERVWREQAEDRVEQAESGAEEAAARLREAQRLQDEAQERAAQAEWSAADIAGQLNEAGQRLAAAAQYVRESDALLDEQREQLQLMRQEITTLRDQVQMLSQEKRKSEVSGPVVEAATQVGAVSKSDAVGGQGLHEAVERWAALGMYPLPPALGGGQRGGPPEAPPVASGERGAEVPHLRMNETSTWPALEQPRTKDSSLAGPSSLKSQRPQKPAPPTGGGSAATRCGRPRPTGDGRKHPRNSTSRDYPSARGWGKPSQPSPHPSGSGRAEVRRAAQRDKRPTSSSVNGDICGRREPSPRRWVKALKFVWGSAVLFSGTQAVSLFGLISFTMMRSGSLVDFRVFVGFLCAILVSLGLTFCAFCMSPERVRLAIVGALCVAVGMSLCGFDVLTLPAVSEEAHTIGDHAMR